MKILNKIVDFIKSLISKVRKPVHVEVSVTSEKKVETTEQVEKPVEQVEVPETSENIEVNALKLTKTVKKTADSVKTEKKTAKRRGRPRKVKSE